MKASVWTEEKQMKSGPSGVRWTTCLQLMALPFLQEEKPRPCQQLPWELQKNQILLIFPLMKVKRSFTSTTTSLLSQPEKHAPFAELQEEKSDTETWHNALLKL